MPDRLFDSLVDDADRIPLARPDGLRRVGNRRGRRRTALLTVTVVLAVIGGILTALRWLPSTTGQPPIIEPTTDHSPTLAPTTDQSPTGAPTSTNAPRRCSATDLQYSNETRGAASGSVVVRYTLVMVGPSACRLDETPVLTYSDGSTRAAIALVPDGAPTEVVVGPDDKVEFTVQTVNGYGGYSTDAPQCATTRVYHQLGLLMPDGGTVPLTGAADLTIQCLGGDGQLGSVTNWTTTQ
jgi:hypothetical protein